MSVSLSKFTDTRSKALAEKDAGHYAFLPHPNPSLRFCSRRLSCPNVGATFRPSMPHSRLLRVTLAPDSLFLVSRGSRRRRWPVRNSAELRGSILECGGCDAAFGRRGKSPHLPSALLVAHPPRSQSGVALRFPHALQDAASTPCATLPAPAALSPAKGAAWDAFFAGKGRQSDCPSIRIAATPSASAKPDSADSSQGPCPKRSSAES